MGSSSPLVLEISSDEEFDFGPIENGCDGGGGAEFDEGDCFDWLSELLGEVGGNKNVVENNADKNDTSDDVVVLSEVLSKKPKKLGFEGLKPVNKGTVDHKVDVGEEDDDDCVILDDDPDKPVAVVKEKVYNRVSSDGGDEDDDLEIVSEKGEVACRDFPHPRHLCAKFPFDSTSHELHCAQCHCYVCDSLAPCSRWGNGNTSNDHCHASDLFKYWKSERKNMKQGVKSASSSLQPTESLEQNHTVRPAIIRPCSGRPLNYGVMKFFSQPTNNSTRPQSQAAFSQAQLSTRNANVTSRSLSLNTGNRGPFTSRVAYMRPETSATSPSNKRPCRTQISGNTYQMHQSPLIRGVHGSNRPRVSSHTAHSVTPQFRLSAAVNMLSRPQLTPRPYSNGFLRDSRATQPQTPSGSFIRSNIASVPPFQPKSAFRPIVGGGFQNMNLAQPVYPDQHGNPAPSESASSYRPTAQYTSGCQLSSQSTVSHDLNVGSYQTQGCYTSMGRAQNGVDSSPNGVGFSQNPSVDPSSLHVQVPEPKVTVQGDNLQSHCTIKDGIFPQQTTGLLDDLLINNDHADVCSLPESARSDSLGLDLTGWMLGNNSSEDPFTVPFSPVWNMFSPEPAILGPDGFFDD